jgi:hypothetical protein
MSRKVKHMRSPADQLFDLTVKTLTPDGMRDFQQKYLEIVQGYDDSDLAIFSTIKLDEYKPFMEWLPSLVESKEDYLPVLVHSMLKRDIMAFKMYNLLQEAADNSEIIIGYNELDKNNELEDKFVELGAGHSSLGIINAEAWLVSEEAANIFTGFDTVRESHDAQDILCTVNDMLGISNIYMDCE